MKKERKGMERLFVIGILFFCFNFLNIHPIAETRNFENNNSLLLSFLDLSVIEPGVNENERFRRLLVREGDSRVIEERIQEWNINVNTKNDQGYTFLHLAVLYNREASILEVLIEKGADVNARTFEEGLTPLHLAAGYEGGSKKVSVLEILIEKGADVNARTFEEGLTPLHLAAGYKKEMERIERLIHFGFYVEIDRIVSDEYYEEKLELFTLLLGKGAQVNMQAKNGITALHLLAFSNNLVAMEYLIKNRADVYAYYGDALFYQKKNKVKGVTPFHLALLNGVAAMEVFRKYSSKFDINVKDSWDRTPLHWAVRYSSVEVIKYLVQNGADLNAQFIDVIDNFEEKLFYINDYSAYIKRQSLKRFIVGTVGGRTALHEASRFRNLEVIDYLFKEGADLKIQDEYGSTPLHRAAFYRTKEVVQYIVEALETEFDVDLRDRDKNTFLHYAAFNNALDVIEYFVQKGGDFESTNHFGETTLMKAAFYNTLDVVKYFVGYRVDVNATSIYGDTALFNAAAHNTLEVVEYLVGNQANINAKNRIGITPLFFAAAQNTLDVVQYLDQEDIFGENTYITDEEGFSLLHYAAAQNTIEAIEVVEYIVGRLRLDINAVSGQQEEDEEEEGTRFPPFSMALSMNTPFSIALSMGTEKVIDYLFSHGGRMSIPLRESGDFHAGDQSGNTPLHYSLGSFSSFDVIKYLIEEKEAPMNVLNSKGHTPLMYAVYRQNDLKILEYLLEKGADVRVEDERGDTVLHWFSHSITDSSYVFRIEDEFNRNWVNRLRNNSIISKIKSFEFLVALVREGADGNIQNNENKTAVEEMSFVLDKGLRSSDTGQQILFNVFEGITRSCDVQCNFWWDPFFHFEVPRNLNRNKIKGEVVSNLKSKF